MPTATRSAALMKAVLMVEKAFGKQDWEALYRGLDAFAAAVLEEGEYEPLGSPEKAKAPEGPKYEPCGVCAGAGERMQEVPSETGHGTKAVMKECGVCKGSGRGKRMKAAPVQAPAPVEKAQEVVLGSEEPTSGYAVMSLVLPDPFWPEVWGVIARDGNPQQKDDWLGLFPDREKAETFRDALNAP